MTLFEIINFGVRDVIEIALVAYLLYQLYRLMRGTIAVQIAVGLGALFLIQVVVEVANMTMLSTIFSYFNQVFVSHHSLRSRGSPCCFPAQPFPPPATKTRPGSNRASLCRGMCGKNGPESTQCLFFPFSDCCGLALDRPYGLPEKKTKPLDIHHPDVIAHTL